MGRAAPVSVPVAQWREQRQEVPEDLVPVRERESGVEHGVHGVHEEPDVFGRAVDVGDDVEAVGFECDADGLVRAINEGSG